MIHYVNQPIIKRFGPVAVRIIALLLFGISLYKVEFANARESGFQTGSRLGGTIAAVNVGKFFYLYRGEETDTPENYDPERLISWGTYYADYGPHFLAVINGFVGQTLMGADYRISAETFYQMLLALFVLSALVFLMPNVPLPLSLAGVLALWFGIRYGPIELFWNPRPWATTYTAILLGMALLTAPLPRKRYWSMAYWTALSVLIAFSLMMRQEVTAAIYGSMFALILAGGAMTVAAYFVVNDRELWKNTSRRLFSRVTAAAVTVIMAAVLLPFFVRGLYSLSWNTPYSETPFNQHGSSLPLYLGLGFVSNPYNIAWLDPVGLFHAKLYEPELRDVPLTFEEVDAPLNKGIREIAVDAPWLIGENILEKVDYMHYYLWHGQTPLPSAFLPGEQPQALQTLYRVALAVPFLMAAVAIYRKELTLLVILSGAAALVFGFIAGPLMAFPSYIGGPQGLTIFSVIMLPAALVINYTKEETLPAAARWRIILWTLGSGAVVIVLAVVLASGWVLLRWNANQDRLREVAAADPLSEIQQMEFRYAAAFNQLEQGQQESIIEALRASGSPSVATPDVEIGEDWTFAPYVAITSEHQLHLIVWLGSAYPGPVDYINQGYVYSIVQLCSGCEGAVRDYKYDPASIVYAFLNDSDWNDSYRMLSFSINAEKFQEPGFFMVVPQRIRFRDGRATDFNYMVDELLQGIRLQWNPSRSD